MVDRFEFELDTTKPLEAWQAQIRANMAAQSGTAEAPA
ncbi:Putative oxygenase [Mycobacteroides abscessus subsp. abscessus]|nr:Putative oxygenase [Mycobacteroides abscessus subsp. abscessus]